jgi:hypothetical protein
VQFVIPGLTRNPGFFWILANERRWFAFAGMPPFGAIYIAAYKYRRNHVISTQSKAGAKISVNENDPYR